MKKLLQDKEEKKNWIRLAKGVVIVAMAILFLEIWVIDRLSTYGGKVNQLKEATSILQLSNQVLESQIAERSALRIIESQADAWGFTSPKKIYSFNSSLLTSRRSGQLSLNDYVPKKSF